MCSVSQPPFYAARIAGTMLVTTHGVITDTNSQPLRAHSFAQIARARVWPVA